MPSTIYTATDVKERRVELLEAASRDRALVRAVDGTALVFTRLDALERAESVAQWALALHTIECGGVPTAIRWIQHLDADDRTTFVAEMWSALEDLDSGSLDQAGLAEIIAAWRVMSIAVDDPKRRQVLPGRADAHDFVPAPRP